MIEAGEVSTLIVKDASRLGREYLQVGYYMEIYFPQKNVRFIAVNDGVDSAVESSNDFNPIRNWANELHAKDTSRKVRAVKKLQAERGEWLGGRPPYGYRKSETTENHLEPDPEAAEVVQKIFTLCAAGKGPSQITRILTEQNILTPANYYFQKAGKTHKGCDALHLCTWSGTTVSDKVRTGQVRVLLGSTAKMGAGTNVQDRLVALHDLDCPWRPGDLAQRKGRIERQGNQNPLVHVYRYVTEGTFDAYLWQTVENKQKFISQIMTSKSPVRSCDDVDETALSFAEIKALCAGDPRIKERMDLDVEVSRLKLMKADHQSKQYRLEDQLLKYFPEEIEKHKGFIKGFESDLEVLAAHPHPEDGFAGMEIRGDLLTDKENAGAALLDACKEVKTSDPVQIGSYRGYAISVEFSAWKQEYTLLLKGQMTHRATLGTDPRGNLTRIDNALAQMPQRLEAAKAQLDNLYQQQAAAKEEVGKPFLYEEELRSKNARLVELDTLLNIDGKGQAHAEAVVAKSTRTSVLDSLKRPATPRSTDKKPKQHEEVR